MPSVCDNHMFCTAQLADSRGTGHSLVYQNMCLTRFLTGGVSCHASEVISQIPMSCVWSDLWLLSTNRPVQ